MLLLEADPFTDNILLAHEILDMLGKKKGRKHGFGVLKIDMSKTYDKVNWVFLKTILLSMKFTPSWVNWILECVSTFHYTLLVNGGITQSFKPAKGLRQGDSLSPYLFLMCANILSLALIKAKNNRKIQGVRLGRNGVSFTHLLFANDSLLFFKRDNKSLANIQQILRWYCSISGQCVNLAKSDLFCSPNISREDQEALAASLQVNLV